MRIDSDRSGTAVTQAHALLRRRVIAAIVIGVVAGGLSALKAATNVAVTMDFEFFWRASQLFADGVNPYPLRPGDAGWPLPDAFFYPAPALLVTWPFHLLVMPAAAGAFMGLGCGLLTWRLSADGLWRLWVLGTPSFIMAVGIGQWSPLITLAALVPGAGFLLACKPTLGLACFAYRPTWRAAAGVALVTAVSLWLLPAWPQQWLENVKLVVQHPAPLTVPLGWLLLAALLRWRQPEARLLLAMACVPQLLFFADQLPLGLVARTRREAVALATSGVAAFTGWWAHVGPGDLYPDEAQPFVMAGFYLPALAIVLLRPNEGNLPDWIESRLGYFRRMAPGQRSGDDVAG